MARPKNDGRGRIGGRKKGTPNKATSDLRENIKQLIEANWENVQSDLSALEPKDRLAFIEKLLRYVVPQESKITQEGETSELLEQIRAREPELADWICQIYLRDMKEITNFLIPPPDTFAEYVADKDQYFSLQS